jgi:hypothetical protein
VTLERDTLLRLLLPELLTVGVDLRKLPLLPEYLSTRVLLLLLLTGC